MYNFGMYLEDHMIPRGLRLRKKCTSMFPEPFKEKWQAILTKASMELMKLLVDYQKQKLEEVQNDLNEVSLQLQPLVSTPDHKEKIERIDKTLDVQDTRISEIKRSKHERDQIDYRDGHVYEWPRKTYNKNKKSGKKKHYNKKKTNTSRRVSFSTIETSTSMSEASEGKSLQSATSQEDLESQDTESSKNEPSTQSRAKIKKWKKGGNTQEEGAENSGTRYGLRNKPDQKNIAKS